MKCGVIMLSEIGDRWDAGFHLLRQEMEHRTAEIAAVIPVDEALARLDRIPLRFKSGLLALGWGSHPKSLSQKTIDPIQRRYPHLCLAIVERDGQAAREALQAEIENARMSIDALDGLCEAPEEPAAPQEESDRSDGRPSLRAGWIYPLADPDRYYDEDDADNYGIDPDKRYSFVRVPSGEDPGDLYLLDVWIVDDEGRTHPGYDACPVPVLAADLVLERGRPLSGETPKPKSIFDSDWLRR